MTPPDGPVPDPAATLQPPPHDDPGVVGNERLTPLAGALLLALIAAEIATIGNIRALMSVHVVVGVVLAGQPDGFRSGTPDRPGARFRA